MSKEYLEETPDPKARKTLKEKAQENPQNPGKG